MQVSLPASILRVGVTGARVLAPAQLPRLRAEISHVLAETARQARLLGGEHTRLLLLSPLAEGADRLAAGIALEHGFSLVCPLPFAIEEYERDFTDPASVDAFRALLARAEGRVLQLDGGRGDAEARSYEAVGRLMIRNVDLVIGIWDGKPGKGLGGTADTIRYAARLGPPVVWVHATDPAGAPQWIEDVYDLERHAEVTDPDIELASYLSVLLPMPKGGAGAAHHSLLHRSGMRAHHACQATLRRLKRDREWTDVEAFLSERPHPVSWPWKLHGWAMKKLAGGALAPWTPPRLPETQSAAAWYDRYQPADGRAGEHARRYRSSYVWTFALGALALSAAALSLAASEWFAVKAAASAMELAALLLILALVFTDGVTNWQLRAIEYRLLAELCRKQQALAPLGWTVPRAGAWAAATPERAREAGEGRVSEATWLVWLFSAWLRETPLVAGRVDAAWVAAARTAALHDLIDDQIDYHQARLIQSQRAGARLVLAGEMCFFTVLIVVVLKLALLWWSWNRLTSGMHEAIIGLGLAGAILPALSAALFGVRAYAELEMITEQSETMLAAMRRARMHIQALDPAEPLASQALGSALAAVATLMLKELDGWARLFRAKVLEA